ncbi:MAG: hypothetical protein AB1779_10205 [Candidatus Thermoplasmatota archaeon]
MDSKDSTSIFPILLWNRTWSFTQDEREIAHDVAVYDGEIYVVGSGWNGENQNDGFLLKYDRSGNLIWNKTWGGNIDEWLVGIAVYNRELYVMGSMENESQWNESNSDVLLLKYDLSGNLLWWKKLPGDDSRESATDLAVYNNEIYVVGVWVYPDDEPSGAWRGTRLWKYDFSGNLLWYSDVLDEGLVGLDIEIDDENGDIFIGGSGEEGRSAFLAKYNANWQLSWYQTWVVSDYSGYVGFMGGPRSIAVYNKEIYISGSRYAGGDGEPNFNSFFFKYNSSGAMLWNKTWSGGLEFGSDIAVDASGIYVIGVEYTDVTPPKTFLLKYDHVLNILWNATWSDDGENDCLFEMWESVAVYEGEIYLVGYTTLWGDEDACSSEDALLLAYKEYNLPIPVISSPLNNSVYLNTDLIHFEGSYSLDLESTDLTFYWYSNLSGYIGTGMELKSTLPAGEHLITLFVNYFYLNVSASVNITVEENLKPIPIISSPKDGEIYLTTDKIDFDASKSTDPNGRDISVYWLSNISGYIGDSKKFKVSLPIGEHKILLKVSDSYFTVEASVNIKVKIPNRKPNIDFYSPSTYIKVIETENLTFSVVVRDPDEDFLRYSWYLNGKLANLNNNYFVLATDYESAGFYEIKVIVSDSILNVSHIWYLTVIDKNRLPVLSIDDKTAYEGKEFKLDVIASDPDKDLLEFSDNTNLFDIDPHNGTIQFTPDYNSSGIYLIKISVTDGKEKAYEWMKLKIINVNRKPKAVISSPSQCSIFLSKSKIYFNGSSSYDLDMDNLSYRWFSNIDGELSDKESFYINLSRGVHVIELEVSDGMENDTISIIVVVNKVVEKGYLPGFEFFAIILGLIVICGIGLREGARSK